MLQLTLPLPPCKQWPCNFDLLCFAGSSQDNTSKFGMWEFLQPGMWCHDYASTQGRKGEAPLLSLGTCSHLWEPKYTDFLQPAKPGVQNGGAEAPPKPPNPQARKPPAFKDDASFACSQLPIQQRKQEPWDQHAQQFACIFIPGLCRQ